MKYLQLNAQEFNNGVSQFENDNTKHYYSYDYKRNGVDKNNPILKLYSNSYSQSTFALTSKSSEKIEKLGEQGVNESKSYKDRNSRIYFFHVYKFLKTTGTRLIEAKGIDFKDSKVIDMTNSDELKYGVKIKTAKRKDEFRGIPIKRYLWDFFRQNNGIKYKLTQQTFIKFNKRFENELHERERITPHTLRRTFASGLECVGTDASKISRLMGNTTRIVEKYYLKSPEMLIMMSNKYLEQDKDLVYPLIVKEKC